MHLPSHYVEKKWLIIPIEVKAREFESRMLLACFAAKAGFSVIIGKQSILLKRIRELPRGIYFDKSISPNKLTKLELRNSLGFKSAVIDEEGLGQHAGFFDVRPRMSDDTIEQTALICNWGKQDAQFILDNFPQAKSKLAITGNPRVDLWRPDFRVVHEQRAKEYRQKYGRYILIPTNFSAANNAAGENYRFEEAKRRGRLKNKAEERHFLDRVDWTKRNYDAFIEMIPQLANRFPELKIIIRPHHAERHEQWLSFGEEFGNVEVIYEGNVTPWILAAECILHHGCSTGIESYIMEKPSITYQPYKDERFDADLGHKLSVPVDNVGDLMDTIQRTLDGNYRESPSARQNMNYAIASVEGRFACESIIDALQHNISVPPQTFSQPLKEKKKRFETLDRVFRALKERVRKKKDGTTLASKQRYSFQKYPGISLDEVEMLLARFAGNHSEFSSLKANAVLNEVFCIYDDA